MTRREFERQHPLYCIGQQPRSGSTWSHVAYMGLLVLVLVAAVLLSGGTFALGVQ